MQKGKLIVFEGADGSGKTTQVKLLLNYLKKANIAYLHYSFPRYGEAWGKMVRRYLDGEFGGNREVNPYLAAILYAGDRAAAAQQIRADLRKGRVVICDRYMASNIAHSVSKFKTGAEVVKFVKWLEDFEYVQNQIPREDLVILLSVDPNISQNLMRSKKKDIHESDKKYLAEVVKAFNNLAKSKSNWVKIECVQKGKILTPGEISASIIKILKSKKILKPIAGLHP